MNHALGSQADHENTNFLQVINELVHKKLSDFLTIDAVIRCLFSLSGRLLREVNIFLISYCFK